MLSEGKSTAIFQFESSGMQDILKRRLNTITLMRALCGHVPVVSGRIVSTVQLRPAGPSIDSQQRALKLIRGLSIEDFGDLADAFFDVHDACPVLPVGDADVTDLHRARLALVVAVRRVLANGLGLLGISAPEKL